MANYWTAFDWGKYERKTAHLTVTEHGAYFLLLKLYYQTGQPLSANADRLLLVCRAFAEPEKAAVLSVLREFFTLEEDGYHNETADEEIAKAVQLSHKRSLAGHKGASSTNGKQSANGSANHPANERQLPTQLQSQIQLHKDIKQAAPSEQVSFVTSKDEPGKWVGRKADKPAFVLPSWISPEAWAGYEEMRRKSRKPMTDRARNLAVSELSKLKEQGNNPDAVLNQSVMNSWQGLFPLKNTPAVHYEPLVGTYRAEPQTEAECAAELNMTVEEWRAEVARISNRFGQDAR